MAAALPAARDQVVPFSSPLPRAESIHEQAGRLGVGLHPELQERLPAGKISLIPAGDQANK